MRKKYIDATLGMAGHASWFLHKNSELHCIGFDQDPFARAKALEQFEKFPEFSGRYQIIPKNFEHIAEAKIEKNFSPDSILFDIGVSSLQFDTPDRGFSFRFDSPLDMRMNPEDKITAGEIVNNWSVEKLEKIFLEYGEESWGKLIAERICERRKISPFLTTTQLAELIISVKPFPKKNRKKNAGGHPAALVFQALRIAVNREFEVLESALYQAIDILEDGGRVAVITFHSLEDRIVKNIFASYEKKGKQQKYPKKSDTGKILEENFSSEILQRGFYLQKSTKKPIIPSPEEIEKNPRARSAKLRCVEKICI